MQKDATADVAFLDLACLVTSESSGAMVRLRAPNMIERDIHVNAGDSRLEGTLCLPRAEGRFPVVLMVHGSGPLDRDQNMKAQKLEIFNTIARHLAESEIASVRFDKRGCGASEGDYYAAGHHDFVHDVVCWTTVLQSAEFCRPGQLFLLGHSEGCLVAAQASVQRPEISGLVLLCPFVEPMEQVLIRQAGQIEQELSDQKGIARLLGAAVFALVGSPIENQRALIRKVRTTTKASIRVWFERVPAKWLRELLDVDTAAVFANVNCPLLLVGGEKDLQCDPADVSRIAAVVQSPVEQHILPGMTHLLRVDDQPPTLLGAQRLLARPMEPEVLRLTAQWLVARSAQSH